MDCSLPGSSIHGIFQARVLEWVAISFSNLKAYHQCKEQVQITEKECQIQPYGYNFLK